MSGPTIGVSQKNDSSLENLHFYARLDTSSDGAHTYIIMVKDNGDELSRTQNMWKAIMEFFSIFSKTTYLLDSNKIDNELKKDWNQFDTKGRKALDFHLCISDLTHKENNKFREKVTSSLRFTKLAYQINAKKYKAEPGNDDL